MSTAKEKIRDEIAKRITEGQRHRATQMELLERRLQQVGIEGLSAREKVLMGLYDRDSEMAQ